MGANEEGQDPVIGSLVGGRYRVRAAIGSGAMGTVYDAEHEELKRPVAIKVLGAAWAASEEAITRFQREAQAASSIGHPNIVDVYDLGRLEDGRPYLAMEKLEGQSLADLLSDEIRLSAQRVAQLISDTASALDAVHGKKLLHRDIKPENLILAKRDDGTETVKLLDFGLAAFAAPDETGRRLTRQGQIHGTPHYMAPEASGGEMPDWRADVYSLAVVAYELLSGVLPFDSPNPVHILIEKMHQDPPRMTAASGIPFPAELEQVVARGMTRDPDERFQSAGAFARELRRVIESLTLQALTQIDTAPPPPAHARGRSEAPQPREAPAQGAGTDANGEHGTTRRPTRRTSRMLLAGTLLLLVGVGGVLAWMRADPEAPASPGPGSGSDVQPTAGGEADVGGTGKATASDASPQAKAAPPQPPPPDEEREQREPVPSAGTSDGEGVGSPDSRDSRDDRAGEPTTGPAPGDSGTRNPADAPESPDTAAPRDDEADADAPEPPRTDTARAESLASEGTKALVQGRLPAAIRHFRNATLADERHAPAWRGLGLANERMGRPPEARRAYERYLELAPHSQAAGEIRKRLKRLAQ